MLASEASKDDQEVHEAVNSVKFNQDVMADEHKNLQIKITYCNMSQGKNVNHHRKWWGRALALSTNASYIRKEDKRK